MTEKLALRFEGCEEFLTGITRLQRILPFTLSGDGIPVRAVCSDHIAAELRGGSGVITYRTKPHFFRALGLFIENALKGADFHVDETVDFDTVGVMLDASRGAVATVETVCNAMDYLAVMGYNMVMMYTEDTFTVDGRPYFGYMRGRYTFEELRACDDYAFEYGIEMLPCIECYGHMAQYLQWPEASGVKDTASVLLAEEEKTYQLLDDMIRCASAPFRSKRIHIGMDEAWDMGRGTYMDLHGEVSRFTIFNRHMEKLMAIVRKYGLTAMMWSDMYFRIASGGTAYYDVNVEIPDSVRKEIPSDVQLVFWHYGEGPGCDDAMLAKHKALGNDVLFAGGLWSWIGHMPENNYAFETTKASLAACRKNGVREMMTTVWANNGCEVHPESLLLGLSFTAEMAYNATPSEEQLRSRFEFCTGGEWQAFWDMSAYHNKFDAGEEYPNFHDRFLGKPLFWQDILEGIYDLHLCQRPMDGHYAEYARRMRNHTGARSELYSFTAKLFELLSVKAEIAQLLKPAYDRNDTGTLTRIRDDLLPDLYALTGEVLRAHRAVWMRYFKSTGWKSLELRYGGMLARIAGAREDLAAYLAGTTGRICELEEDRLPVPLGGFVNSSAILKPLM